MSADFPPKVYMEKREESFCGFKVKDYYSSSSPLSPANGRSPIRILLVRPNSLGDVLFVYPVARVIKEQYPLAEIFVHTLFPDVFQYCNFINGTHKGSIDKRMWDKVFFLSYEFTPYLHPVESYARICGVSVNDKSLGISLSLSNVHKGYSLLDSITKKKAILIHTECDWRSRRWGNENWELLIAEIKGDKRFNDYEILSVCRKDQQIKGAIDLSGKTSDFGTLLGVISNSEFMIAIDSGIMHLGVALNKKVHSLFGITKANLRLPHNYLKWALQSGHPYSGSHHNRPMPADREDHTKLPQATACMNAIHPDTVFANIVENLDARSQH